MKKHIISTNKAPAAVGTYSQAVAVTGGTTIYLSGQIPLVPETMEVVEGGIDCLLYTSPSPRDGLLSRMPSSA